MSKPKSYTKLPVTIQAMLFESPEEQLATLAWVNESGGEAKADLYEGGMLITTLEGEMRVSPGDYVIQGIHGEFYPCKPDIFKATYIAFERKIING